MSGPLARRNERRGDGFSDIHAVEKEHLNAGVIRRQKAAIRPGRSSLHVLANALFDRGKVVEMQRSDQMNIGRSRRRCDGALADLVSPETGNFLGERHVDFKVMPSGERLDILQVSDRSPPSEPLRFPLAARVTQALAVRFALFRFRSTPPSRMTESRLASSMTFGT